ncbi:DUF1249 domain-containing protein [Pseudidiomarina taiwanensis]|uniref:DUF1249 domain-containing protein n=1 Tax=Pseudidiomarina taiwanensis TaxID=337250 RepID=A0A432ZM87_9GAMM|nr:DUF1249 domain-containing protein [Pseudidiomarina taiwanensis]RUO78986.1 DUF1249 domain-containing protein [Pseudidiomarina taiwanensis]
MTNDVKRQRYHFDLAGFQRMASLNYARLRRLVERLGVNQSLTLVTPSTMQVECKCLNHAPYTSDIELTQVANLGELPGTQPVHLEVRLYHDAKLAEVTAAQGVRRLAAVYPQPNQAMHQTNEKYQVNQFLHEWLQLLKQH